MRYIIVFDAPTLQQDMGIMRHMRVTLLLMSMACHAQSVHARCTILTQPRNIISWDGGGEGQMEV